MTKVAEMAKRGRAQVDVQEKRTWLNKWIEEQPRTPTIKEAKEALKKQFGEALGTSYIANTLTVAHQIVMDDRRRQMQAHEPPTALAVVPEATTSTESLREVVRKIAALMRVNNIKNISISDDDQIQFDAALKL